ncbi:Stp1/IreP family PP2C-type Ser/Thr phosphatase [Thermodesulfobacteriota bacterium]
MLVKSSGITDVGLKRDGNEDSFSVEDSLGLYIVADGMGGHLAGEVASQISVEMINKTFRKWLEEEASEDEIFGEPDYSLSREGNYVLGGIRLANRVVYELALEKKQYHGMGTTVVVMLVTPTLIITANVGDSRIYLIRDGELEQLSKDHSIVSEQVELGMMTEEEAANSPMKHILTRNLGSSENVEPDIFEIEPSNNDCFVLCSDGLTDLVNDEEILEMAQDEHEPEKLCHKYIDKVLKRGAHDNTTIISIFLTDVKKSRGGPLKKFGFFIADLLFGIQKTIKKIIP